MVAAAAAYGLALGTAAQNTVQVPVAVVVAAAEARSLDPERSVRQPNTGNMFPEDIAAAAEVPVEGEVVAVAEDNEALGEHRALVHHMVSRASVLPMKA